MKGKELGIMSEIALLEVEHVYCEYYTKEKQDILELVNLKMVQHQVQHITL
jgi:hypothetical protein